MELDDCAFPLLAGVVCTDDPNVGFKDTDYALLVGARPRGPGMERKDLLEANAAIFSVQGKALNDHASRTAKVLVVGNPANTNALITQRNAPDLDPRNFTAMTRLDHNRAATQIAQKTGTTVNDVTCMTIWGNHSATQYPDLFNARVKNEKAIDLIDQAWYEDSFIPTVQQRGAAIIEARGASSAASAANAAIDHMRSWALGTEGDNWVSMGVYSDGSYGIPQGLIYSFPCRCDGGDWSIVQGVDVAEQDHGSGLHHRGQGDRQTIVVSEPQLFDGHGVILVDHRDDPSTEDGVERASDVQQVLAMTDALVGEEQLGAVNPVP